MQDNHLFEYAVVRVVPHVEREEFINVGVVLLCSTKKFLKAIFTVDESKIKMLCRHVDMEEINKHIASFEKVCAGGKEGGPIGALSLAERFRWLTATRSTVLQTSKVHPGLTNDPEKMINHLHQQLVLQVEC